VTIADLNIKPWVLAYMWVIDSVFGNLALTGSMVPSAASYTSN
jgi:hypothetical protein